MMSREWTRASFFSTFRSKGRLRKKKTGELLAPLVSPKKRKRGDSESSASSKYGRKHERIISEEPKQVHNVDSCKVERQYNDVVVNVEAMIKSMPSSNCCIFRVPEDLRRKEEKFMYKPKILSIGPFYHGKERLQLMENHKQWYLRAFLDRSKPLNELVEAIGNLESEARKCYAEPMDSLTRNQFVQMMLFDGCFILELLYRYYQSRSQDTFLWQSDQIFTTNWMLGSLCHDLILLENQIPFIVLEALFNLSNVCDETLNKHVARFFESILAMEQPPLNGVTKGKHLLGLDEVTEGKHLLDLLRNCLFPSLPRAKRGDKSNWEFTKCATNLSQAGVKFEKNEKDSYRLLNIEFSSTTTGVLQIPPLTLKSVSFVLLLNLIALEQCIGHDDLVTSYVVFIDSLINSAQDVELLSDSKIIDCSSIEAKTVAIAINTLCKNVEMREFYYDGLSREINIYCGKKRHRWCATLKREYFHNPWAIISVIAAIFLLFLTLTQTVFAILAYPAFH